MKVLFLNLPYPTRIQRRYMCSYNAPNQLLPPQELMSLAAIAKRWKNAKAIILDAIAEEIDLSETIKRIDAFKPDLIVTISSFECFEEDLDTYQSIMNAAPHARAVLFGYYATHFYKEILDKYSFDFIILGEPDLIFSDLYDALMKTRDLSDVEGIAYKLKGQLIVQPGEERVARPEDLPMPAYELISPLKYFEPFMPAPLGLIQTARGCPYSCNYCVKSYGKKLTYRTPAQILEEIIYLKKEYGIKSLRFIDDTFTVHNKRVIELCQLMIAQKPDIEWTCLSRTDTLKRDTIAWMKKAGCKRIYFGVESGSAEVLKHYDKEINVAQSYETLAECKKQGIETSGLFMVGAPFETENDFNLSVNFAIQADFDYIVVGALIPYPGTVLFDSLKEEINFSALPYKNEWKNPELKKIAEFREKEFYRLFYLRPRYVTKSAGKALRKPVEFVKNSLKLAGYIYGSSALEKRTDFI